MQETVVDDVAEVASGETLATVRTFVAQAVRPTTKVIYLLGCGGSHYMFGVLKYLLAASPIPAVDLNSAEFTATPPAALGADSIVIASSTHGTTMETAEAITVARKAGAPVLLVSQTRDNPCGEAAEYIVNHNGVEAKQVLLTVLAHELLMAQDAVPDGVPSAQDLVGIGEVFPESNRVWDEKLNDVAAAIAQAPVTFIAGSGPNDGAADTLAACYLMEMQNLVAVASGANDFLHGTHEMVAEPTNIIVFLGEDGSRSVAQRTADFGNRFSDNCHVLDTEVLPMTGVDPKYRGTVSAILFASSIIALLAKHVEAKTNEPLISRKYMWKVEY
ncbi:SIS domain-containing protein [Brevibacterium sp. 50QC2O2]|uniref:SIS domain-containing protein n=1 Tax=unclassified Brevibacterium TaxID=2614124 RepID=UPI00211C46DC|nr:MULTISPECIES: SIS domain-containing protein [unclassified Brevibacterium]MCQ9367046.1 SIS domain-containing protein [Brevibacterium sp. 91QC2O2]MCQ9388270.1 SIS domain-containing protein [Brevibacterium sp. 50QC2O2]